MDNTYKQYAFDVTLRAVVRTNARSLPEAIKLIRTEIQAVDLNFETEGGVITEVWVDGKPELFECDGVETNEDECFN